MRVLTTLAVAAALGVSGAAVAATQVAAWSSAQKIDTIGGHSSEVNTPSLDGCPIQSPDGLSLYIASNRPGGRGGLDIWVAHPREHDGVLGSPAEPGRAGQLGGGRLLSDAGRQGRLVLREPGAAARSVRPR